MSKLPKVDAVKYDIQIKELNKKVKYRPFTVKEHRILLQAIESGSEETLTNAILDLLKACTFGTLDIDKLPTHIVDFLYLQVHIKSTGAIQEATYRCGNVVDKVVDGEQKKVACGGQFTLKLPLDRAEIAYPEDYEKKKIIMVDDKVGIKLIVPSLEKFKAMKPADNVLDLTDQYIFACVDCIFEGDKSIQKAGVDFNEQELLEWLGGLDGTVMNKIGEFFKELPYLKLELPITCPSCGRKEVMELKGLNDFFG